MQSERHPAPSEPNERAADEGRLTIERAEEAWQRQVEGENAAASAPSSSMLRIVLLGAAIAAIIFLLFQRLAQIG
jgi:predicted secreted protein